MPKTKIKFCGFDSWCRPVFTDQKGNLYVDINMSYPDLNGVALYTKCNNEFDGEPDDPVDVNNFIIISDYLDK